MTSPSLRNRLRSRHAEIVATRRFFLLFLFLLGSLAFYPYTEGGGARYYVFRFLGFGIVLLSVYAVSFRRTLLLVAALLALGTPGITPVSGEARSLSVIEAILGILYLAILISRLMAAYRGNTPLSSSSISPAK